MSVHINYRVMCEGYYLARALGLSHEQTIEQFPMTRCLILSKHTELGRMPTTEGEARAGADAAGWVRRDHPAHGEIRSFDLCPVCAPELIELEELRVAEAVLLS